jgi:hypothetical protein
LAPALPEPQLEPALPEQPVRRERSRDEPVALAHPEHLPGELVVWARLERLPDELVAWAHRANSFHHHRGHRHREHPHPR